MKSVGRASASRVHVACRALLLSARYAANLVAACVFRVAALWLRRKPDLSRIGHCRCGMIAKARWQAGCCPRSLSIVPKRDGVGIELRYNLQPTVTSRANGVTLASMGHTLKRFVAACIGVLFTLVSSMAYACDIGCRIDFAASTQIRGAGVNASSSETSGLRAGGQNDLPDGHAVPSAACASLTLAVPTAAAGGPVVSAPARRFEVEPARFASFVSAPPDPPPKARTELLFVDRGTRDRALKYLLHDSPWRNRHGASAVSILYRRL